MSIRLPRTPRALAAAMACALALCADAGAQLGTSLWVSDDVNTTIYHVDFDGTLLGSFASGSISGLDVVVGTRSATLWTAKEGSNLILHVNKKGKVLSSFPGTTYDANASAPEGVAVDPADGTLWIVDDDTNRVYNVQTNGSLISSFPMADFDAAAQSPQAIAADPWDGTLWITDNGTDRAYNVTREGVLITSLKITTIIPGAGNVQGISVHPVDRTLWITERSTHSLYELSRAGTLLTTLDTSVFGSLNPTGVAVQVPKPPTYTTLLVDLQDGVDEGLITAKLADRLAQFPKAAMAFHSLGNEHGAANQLMLFVALVEALPGGEIHPFLAGSLKQTATVLSEGLLKGS